MHVSDGIGWPYAPVLHDCQRGQGGASMARGRLGKVSGVLLIALSFLLLVSVACAPVVPPTPTSGPQGQTFSFPWPPDWVARGKDPKMVLPGLPPLNPRH